MKKTKSLLGLFAACFAIVLALAVWAGINPPVSVSASSFENWGNDSVIQNLGNDYVIENYETEMRISSDRVISVKERITASFSRGYTTHGIIRDLPLGGGVVYRNVSAKCENSTDFSPYFQSDDISYLSYYLGGKQIVTGQTRIYVITYDMVVPALKADECFPLEVLGYGWQTSIDSFTATISLPGELKEKPVVYSGDYGTTANNKNALIEKIGEREYRVTAKDLYNNGYYMDTAAGITVNFYFQDGMLTTKADLSILYAFLAGAVLIGVACVLRFVKYRRLTIIKPVTFTVPDGMDPFLMGKLIDDKIDKEDYGAVFFYLASKGYVHIDLTENKKNPTIYRSQKPFGADEPDYCKAMYDALFYNRESVKISNLSNSFYVTADRMKSLVTEKAGKNYRGVIAPLVICGFLALLLLGGFAWLFALLTVSRSYMWWATFIGCLFSFLPPALGVNTFTRRRYKWKTVSLVFTVLGLFLVGVLFGFLFSLIPSPAFGWGTSFVLGICSSAAGVLAGDCITPKKAHAEKLGQILGFKQFIVATEREKIEFMLKDDPELYYKILPYAQVLGITKAWTEKFKGLEIVKPSYCSNTTALDYVAWGMMFSALNSSLSKNMSMRPSSPKGGHGGGIGRGGFGGGFGGGGFGGGGGRSF